MTIQQKVKDNNGEDMSRRKRRKKEEKLCRSKMENTEEKAESSIKYKICEILKSWKNLQL